MTKQKHDPLVIVRWRDSCSPVHKWQDAEMGRTYNDLPCTSVGWLTRNDKICVVVSASRSEGGGIGDLTAIPKPAVLSIKRLHEKGRKK